MTWIALGHLSPHKKKLTPHFFSFLIIKNHHKNKLFFKSLGYSLGHFYKKNVLTNIGHSLGHFYKKNVFTNVGYSLGHFSKKNFSQI